MVRSKQMVEERVLRESESLKRPQLAKKYGRTEPEIREFFDSRDRRKPRVKSEISRLRRELPEKKLLGLLLEKSTEELCEDYKAKRTSMSQRIKEVTNGHRKPLVRNHVDITKEELIEASKLFSEEEIATLYDCSRATIARKYREAIIKKHCVNPNTRRINSIDSAELLEVSSIFSRDELAFLYDVGRATIVRKLREARDKKDDQKHVERALRRTLPAINSAIDETLKTFSYVNSAIDYLISQRPQAERMAAKYILEVQNYRGNSEQFNKKLLKLCKSYIQAKKEGEKVSITKLSKKSGFHTAQIYRIGKALDWDLRVRKYQRGVITPIQNWRIIETNINSELTNHDIAKFLGLSPTPIIDAQERTGIERLRKTPIYTRNRAKVGYYAASMVYESLDEGYSVQDSAEIAGVSIDDVLALSERREELEKKIISGLRRLTGKKVEKPYLPIKNK
ncbi:MAG: hypothetical protein AABW73_01485 [Nanoarchaeota archaeon]